MATYNWTPEQKQRFFDYHGFWPNQFRGDAHALEGAPQTILQGNLPERPELNYPAMDVRALGQRREDEKRAMLSMGRNEINSMVAREEALTSKVVNLARAFGSNVSYTAPQGGGRGTSSADPAKGTAKEETDRLFADNFNDLLEQAGGQLSPEEIAEFLNSQKAGPAQYKMMKDMAPFISLGDIKEFYRIGAGGNVEYLYRRENSPDIPDVLAGGWKDNLAGIDLQRAIDKETAATTLNKKVLTLKNTLAGLPAFVSPEALAGGVDPALKIPRSTEELRALQRALGLTTVEEIAALEKHFEHLKKPADKSWYVHPTEGQKRMTAYEAEKANAKTENKKNKWTQIAGDKLAEKTNTDRIQEVINSAYDSMVAATKEGSPGQAVRMPDAFTLGTRVYKALQGRTDINKSDRAEINKMISSSLQSGAKEAHTKATNTALISQNIEKIKTFDGMEKFLAKNPTIGGEQRSRLITDWQALNPHLAYEGTKTLWNNDGEPAPVQIANYADYLKYKTAYPHEKWEDVTNKPTVAIDYSVIDQNQDFWQASGIETKTVDGKVVKTPINETRYTAGKEERIYKDYRSSPEFTDSVKAINHITETADKILTALAGGISPGKPTGTLDGFTIKWIEKLLDPTGVVRASDVEFIQTFGHMREGLNTLIERLKADFGEDGWMSRSVMISPELRRDFAEAVVQVYTTVMKNNTTILGYMKDRFNTQSEQYKTQDGGALNFNRVMPQTQWNDYSNYSENVSKLKVSFDEALAASMGIVPKVDKKDKKDAPAWNIRKKEGT